MKFIPAFPTARYLVFILGVLIIAHSLNPDNAYCQTVVKLMASQPSRLQVSLGDNINAVDNSTIILSDNLSINGGTPPYTYSWLNGTEVISTESSFEITPGNVPVFYTVRISDNNGCISTSSVSIMVGIEDNELNFINVYPVPATSFLTIDPGTGAEKIKADLINYTGNKIWSGDFSEKYDLNLNYPAGIYFLKLYYKKKVSVRKIVINKNF